MRASFPEGVSVVSLGSHVKTLPSRASLVLELHLIPTLSNKLSWLRLLAQLCETACSRHDGQPNDHGSLLRYTPFYLWRLGISLEMPVSIT